MEEENKVERHYNTESKEQGIEIKLFLPVLPGRGEAWRRFAQELSGPRRKEWLAWRERMGVLRLQAWISAGQQSAGVYIRARLESPAGDSGILVHEREPFERWLREQIFALHGLDLAQLQDREKWESVPEITEAEGR